MFQVFVNGDHFGEFSHSETSLDEICYMIESNGIEVLDVYVDPEFGDVELTCSLDD
jgi:hypothetical protein